MKFFLLLILTIVGIVVATSCKLFNKKQSTLPPIAKNTPYFSLSKSPCRGTCTVYDISIDQAGNATFKGVRNTEKVGNYTAKLSAKQFANLQTLLKSKDFASLQKDYPTKMKDMQTFTMRYEQYHVYFQRKDGPKVLFSLIDALDELVKELDWK